MLIFKQTVKLTANSADAPVCGSLSAAPPAASVGPDCADRSHN